MKGLFDGQGDGQENPSEGINLDDLPNPDAMHEHLSGLLDGKLGKLAAEIAEETAQEFKLDIEGEDGAGDVSDVFQKLFKNPGKLMGLVNNISKKLDAKLKSGDLNENDLMQEAGDLMTKMKNMPGMPNIEELLKNMNVPKNKQGMAKQMMNQNMRVSGTKARLQRKLEERRAQMEANSANQTHGSANQTHASANQTHGSANQTHAKLSGNTFSDGSKPERSKIKKKKTKKK